MVFDGAKMRVRMKSHDFVYLIESSLVFSGTEGVNTVPSLKKSLVSFDRKVGKEESGI